VQRKYEWLEQQDANGNIKYSTLTLPGRFPRQTTCLIDGSCRTWFLGDDEVSYLFGRCASSSTLNQRFTSNGVYMHRFYLPFSSATSLLSREDLIHAYTVYESTYSPDAGVTRNDISYLVLQHQLQINETPVSTMTALMESAFPPGATIYGPLPVRHKLLTTGLTSTRCLDLSVA
jgi:hypothetical protein